MPITRLQFDLGLSATLEDMMRRTLEFLRNHADQAFSMDEIHASVSWEQLDGLNALSQALDHLTHLGGVDVREVRGETYYAYLGAVPELE